VNETANVRFWFDFISPNAYIAWTQIGALVERCGARLEPLPVLYAALLDAHDLSGPAERPAKRAWMVANVMRKVAQIGIPFGPPPSHPFNPLLALRCCMVEMDRDERLRLIDALFRAAWGGGGGVTEPAAVAAAARDAGLDGEALVRQAGTDDDRRRRAVLGLRRLPLARAHAPWRGSRGPSDAPGMARGAAVRHAPRSTRAGGRLPGRWDILTDLNQGT
jgi:2-hydroxychromene-2-carboxylate isomerase